MKKLLAFFVVVLVVACGNHDTSVQLASNDSLPSQNQCGTIIHSDTLWDTDGMWCDIQQPFTENGHHVLYRHITFYEGDTQIMDYVYIPRGSVGHKKRVESVYGDVERKPDFEDVFLSHGSSYTHVNLGDLPRDLFMIVRYKGKPVISADFTQFIHFTDSTMVYFGMEDYVDQLRGVERLPNGGYALKLVRYDYAQNRTVDYCDTLPPLDKEFIISFRGTHYTIGKHLKDFDLIDVDNWTELVEPLDDDYEL